MLASICSKSASVCQQLDYSRRHHVCPVFGLLKQDNPYSPIWPSALSRPASYFQSALSGGVYHTQLACYEMMSPSVVRLFLRFWSFCLTLSGPGYRGQLLYPAESVLGGASLTAGDVACTVVDSCLLHLKFWVHFGKPSGSSSENWK